MRQITKQACDAFQNREKFSKDNTHTDGTTLFLYDNEIAKWLSTDADGENVYLYISNAGWPTVTTKERLNGLKGVNIGQEKGIWYLNGFKWSGKWVRVDGFTGDIEPSEEEEARAMVLNGRCSERARLKK